MTRDVLIPNVNIPEGKYGVWAVEKFSISDSEARFENMKMAFHGCRRHVIPGTYTKLTRNGRIIMSDTPAEKCDHFTAVLKATGDVLIAGLGLGMVLNAVAMKPDVSSVTVLEIADGPCELVWPTYVRKYGDKIQLIKTDVHKWEPPKGARWDTAWFDIWDDICGDNWQEYKTLTRRFCRRASWLGMWCKEETRRAA